MNLNLANKDNQMKSFHGDEAVKQKYINRIKEHKRLDQIVQGTGFDQETKRGCAVGCTLDNYSHDQYSIELGLPVWLAYLEDKIHEGLTLEEAKKWPLKFLEAIPVGISEEKFTNLFHEAAIFRQKRNLALQKKNLESIDKYKNTFVYECIQQSIEAIELVIQYHETKNESAWSAAESAASSAAWSAAESAAWSAAWSASSAAWSASSAASSAARSAAESAAESAWSAAYKQESLDLLRLLRGLKND